MNNGCRRNFRMGEGRVMLMAVVVLSALCIIMNVNRTPRGYHAAPVSSVYRAEEDVRLDLNLATREDLMELPGVGEVLAERILAYREANGGFVHVEELGCIEGISEGRLAGIRDYVEVSQAICE